MSDNPTATLLACPSCDGTTFSWLVEAVQSGPIHHIDGRYDEYGDRLEQITSCDDDDHGVVCTTCYEEHERDDLILADEA